MQCQLSEILDFKHSGVIQRFQKEHPHLREVAPTIFADLMGFFWLSQKHHLEQKERPTDPSLNFVFIMDEEMKNIDLMWHVFLLYTKDYMDFCQRYFGEYIHHLPDIVPGMETAPDRDFQGNLERFLSYSYDGLGEETVARWFAA